MMKSAPYIAAAVLLIAIAIAICLKYPHLGEEPIAPEVAPAVPAIFVPAPAIFKRPLVLSFEVNSDGRYHCDVVEVLGHHFLVTWSTDQVCRTCTEFTMETHIGHGPEAKAPAGAQVAPDAPLVPEVRKVPSVEGGSWPTPPKPPQENP